MAYQTLARKYRPVNFEELVGQESTTLVLKNAIRMNREPHGVIFSGVRGVGKTTLARLYAKALNCTKGPTAEPCHECESCLAIAKGSHEDVLEIDGASNTGIDDIRALQDTLAYVPQRSKFKIYIIDEVHMLSTYAFNALLKSLEEPPAQVVFIFATTELNKIPETIVSRCLTFHLQKIPIKTIHDRLKVILDREGIPFEDKALGIIAREGHGSLRDALTLLDSAIAMGEGKIEFSRLEQMYSSFSSSPYLKLLEALIERKATEAISVIGELDELGRDLDQVIEETAKLSRHAFVVRDLGPKALDTALLGLDDSELAKLLEIGKKASPFDLNRIFRTLVQCRKDLDGSGLDRYVSENYILEWCLDPGLPLLDDQILEIKDKPRGAPLKSPRPAPPQNNKLASFSLDDPQTEKKPSDPVQVDIVSSPSPSPPIIAQAKPPAPAATENKRHMPATWEELVETWKKEKPLQARQLEEVHILEYSGDRIIGAVNEDTLAGRGLLQKEAQLKLKEQFASLFDFHGQITITSSGQTDAGPNLTTARATGTTAEAPGTTNASPAVQTAPSPKSQALPESILQKKQQVAAENRTKIQEDAKNNPLTKSLLEVFNGEIEDIKVDGSV